MSRIIFETERLILEKIDENHFGNLCSLLSNENVHRFFPKTLSKAESIEFYEKIHKRYIEDGYCFWAVIRKYDHLFIGICGLLKQVVEDIVETEVAYRISDVYWGNGYGAEAAKGCMDYAKAELGKLSIISLIREVNKPSIGVAEKNGLIYERDVLFNNLIHRVYRKVF